MTDRATDREVQGIAGRVAHRREQLPEIRANISEAVTDFKEDTGLTQIELADLFGVSQGTISAWLNVGTDKLTNILLISAALGKDVESFTLTD